MPAHAFLRDEQVAEILTYIKTTFTHGGGGVSVEEVQVVRARQ